MKRIIWILAIVIGLGFVHHRRAYAQAFYFNAQGAANYSANGPGPAQANNTYKPLGPAVYFAGTALPLTIWIFGEQVSGPSVGIKEWTNITATPWSAQNSGSASCIMTAAPTFSTFYAAADYRDTGVLHLWTGYRSWFPADYSGTYTPWGSVLFRSTGQNYGTSEWVLVQKTADSWGFDGQTGHFACGTSSVDSRRFGPGVVGEYGLVMIPTFQ